MTVLAGLAAVLTTVLTPPRAAGATSPTITRLVLLPLIGRSTVAIELSEPVARLDHVQPVPTEVVIEGGPVSPAVQERWLEPPTPSPLVRSVSLSPSTPRQGASYFKVRIVLATAATHQLRVVGSRLYVDLSPSVASPTVVPGHDPSRQEVEARSPGGVTVNSDKPKRSGIGTDTAYSNFESSTLPRARELAARPDVKGLLRLREQIEKRDAELGKKQPELVGRLLDELARITGQARALQLERDRGSFLEKP